MSNKNESIIIRHIGSSTVHIKDITKAPKANESLGGKTKTNVSTNKPKKGK